MDSSSQPTPVGAASAASCSTVFFGVGYASSLKTIRVLKPWPLPRRLRPSRLRTVAQASETAYSCAAIVLRSSHQYGEKLDSTIRIMDKYSRAGNSLATSDTNCSTSLTSLLLKYRVLREGKGQHHVSPLRLFLSRIASRAS